LPVLHVRIASPPGLTERLLQALTTDGVEDLVVLQARRPDGDVVQFDLPRGSANAVFQRLRDPQLAGLRSVMIEAVDASLTEPESARPAFRRDAQHGELAPVWEMVETGIRAGGIYPPSFFILLVIAALIAGVGILTNSQILIVGAMVVGPEYGAIIAVALGIERHRARPVRQGLTALLAGFLIAIAAAVIFGAAIRWSNQQRRHVIQRPWKRVKSGYRPGVH